MMQVRILWELPRTEETPKELGKILTEILSVSETVKVEWSDVEGLVLEVKPVYVWRGGEFRRRLEELKQSLRYTEVCLECVS